MKFYAKIGALLLLSPTILLAHGQEIIFLPFGQVFGLGVVLIAALILRMSGRRRLALVLSALVAIVVTWFTPVPGFYSLHRGGRAYPVWLFLEGLLGPILVAGVVFLASRSDERNDKK